MDKVQLEVAAKANFQTEISDYEKDEGASSM
jgi:hypothetical protein